MIRRVPVRPRALLVPWLAACAADPIALEGEIGRPIALVSGDGSPLPRLLFIDESCPGVVAAGGCPNDDPARVCKPILLDSLLPLTSIATDVDAPDFTRTCVEVRAGAGMAAPDPSPEAVRASVTRFRFGELPVVLAPGDDATGIWEAGDETLSFTLGGVLGGNLLREFAVAIRTPPASDPPDSPTVSFYGEFPGDERDLANQGRAYFPLQFPGRLLGKDLNDVCDIDGDPCYVGGFDIQSRRPNIALSSTRMVLDACVAAPPCGVDYEIDAADPLSPGTCREARGPDLDARCVEATDPLGGGVEATLVVATGVPGIVLFADSAARMFGPPDALPRCETVGEHDRACLESREATLYLPGWPPATIDATTQQPLPRLRVRSVAIVPGLTRSRGPSACTRVRDRHEGLLQQCQAYVDAYTITQNAEDTQPPYTDHVGDNQAASSLGVLGEARLAADAEAPDPGRWLEAIVIPADHPLPLALRRDVTPEAIQPDGLLGAALFDDTVVVLDYTDPNPGLRLSCLDGNTGRCLAAPECQEDGDAACCFGLPRNLLVEFITAAGDETCCGALSAEELAELQPLGHCSTTLPP